AKRVSSFSVSLMTTSSGPCLRSRIAPLLAFAFAFSHALGAAADTGTISGRILNPETGEYVRNAQVSIRGSAITAVSDDNGVFRLAGVPAGEAVIAVNYTGYSAEVATVRVTAGQN